MLERFVFLSQGEIDMSATTAKFGAAPASNTVGDADVVGLLGNATEVGIFVVVKNTTRQGGAFFNYLNLTLVNLETDGLFKTVDRYNCKHNCLYLALQAGGLPYVKLQHLTVNLRSRIIHKCDLTNVCNAL